MSGKNKKFYITTSIAYTNAPPHIGFAFELIQADVLARYQRLLGEDVLFLTGTDEHGIKIARVSEKEGKQPQEFVDDIAKKFRKLAGTLNISNDDFIRTTDKKNHWPVVEKVWRKLKEGGDIYKKNYQGFYCSGCEAFITKKDLINGKCPIHQKEPEAVEEENYFFRLSKYSDKIKEAIKEDKIKIIPESRKNETLNLLEEGREDISFSRPRKDLKWGIPVPDDETQTIYVWGDALTNYISALGYPNGEKFKKYWPADIHCLGKDIMKFHTIIWPAMLLSLNLDLPRTVFVHGFITSNGQKMSKSLGNVVDPFELVEKYGADAVRYFLLREIPSTEDGDFSYEKFETRYNSDLAGGIGNLVARVRTMAEAVDFTKILPDEKIVGYLIDVKVKYRNSIEEFKFNEALICVWDVIHYCDSYINENKPWEKNKGYEQVLRNLLEALSCISLELLPPFLPQTAENIFNQIEIDKKTGKFKNKKGESLFPRI